MSDRPDIVVVMKGDAYSKNVGGEQRRTSNDAAATFDGIAINGFLLSVDEYRAPLHALDAERMRRDRATVAEFVQLAAKKKRKTP